jgi:hypothetical protein
VLPTGRPGTGVGIGVEPASDDAAPQPVGGPVDEEAR